MRPGRDRGHLGETVIGRGGVELVHADGGAVGQRAGGGGLDDDGHGRTGACGRLPRARVKTPSTGVTPPGAETNVTPKGSVSVSVTPVPAAVPLLVTVNVSVTLFPTVTEPGAAPESARSGVGTPATWPIVSGPPSGASVNQMFPSGPVAIPIGPGDADGRANSVMAWVVGLISPILSALSR